MVAALIQFTQGVTVGGPGLALYGTVGAPVVVSNVDDTGVAKWVYTVIDAPPSSAIAPGIVQSGTNPTWTFVPDSTDMFFVRLDVYDASNLLTSSDARCFGVKRTSGRIIPAFSAVASSLNFLAQLRGWASIMEVWLNFLDGLTGGGGGGGSPPIEFTVTHTTTSSATAAPSGGVATGLKVRVDVPFNAGTLAVGQTGTPNLLLPPSGAGSLNVVSCPAGTVYEVAGILTPLANAPILATVVGAASGSLTIFVPNGVPVP